MKAYLEGRIGETTTLPTTRWGDLVVEVDSLTDAVDGDLVVTVPGRHPSSSSPPLARIHSECVFGEVFGSVLCDCAEQFDMAMTRLSEEGGLLFYLRLDGRGEGLAAKVAATRLEVAGADTWDSRIAVGATPESRSFDTVAQHLLRKGISSVRLLTNNPDKIQSLEHAGVSVQREPLIVANRSLEVQKLYDTKVNKFGHLP